MANKTLTDALDNAVDRMAHGVDAELCATQDDNTLLPLLQVARGLFDLAAEYDEIDFTPRRGADAIDWASLLSNTPQRPASNNAGSRPLVAYQA